MAINNFNVQPQSFAESNPTLQGLLQSQDFQQKFLANQLQKKINQYATQNQQANLIKTLLQNQILGVNQKYAEPMAQAELGQKNIANALKNFGLSQASGDDSNQNFMMPPMPQQQFPINQQQATELDKLQPQSNDYYAKVASTLNNHPEIAEHPEIGKALVDQLKQQYGMQSANRPVPIPNLGMQNNPEQQQQALRDKAQRLSYAFPDAAKVLNEQASQLMRGSFPEQKKTEFDLKKLAEAQDSAASAGKGTYFLNDFEKLVNNIDAKRFYPGIGRISGLTNDEYQSLQRDAENMGNLLPHLFGVPSKGFNVKLEESLRRLAGNPHGQLKGTLQHDVENLRELFDQGTINSALVPYIKNKQGHLDQYRPYTGDLSGYFDSKEEYHNWLKSQPNEVQVAVHRQISKRKGGK